MKRISFVFLLIILFFADSLFAGTEIRKEQTDIVTKVMKKAGKGNYDKAAEIINYIDNTYGSLYERLNSGGKFTIYFGPAHGKDNTGRWHGTTSERIGVTGLPEEYYSMNYSRKFYNLLKNNKFIEVSTAPYYRDVLEGKSDSYHYMKFVDVAENAYNAEAFLVIEMHMNNVSVFEKADGLVNMPGIHMIRDSDGRKMLKNITGCYSGYLTLYNKYDASGFSKQYAVNIKNSLQSKGYSINGWEYGAVGDDRFTYYLLFPVSVIYECGFISHPAEEKKLKDAAYIDGMVNSHYEMLLKTIHDVYGIDITGNTMNYDKKDVTSRIELLKLARLTIFFIENDDVDAATEAVNGMKKYNNSASSDSIEYYSSLLKRAQRAEYYYNKGIKYRNKKKYHKSREYFIEAKDCLNRNVMYSALKEKYNNALYGNRSNRNSAPEKKPDYNFPVVQQKTLPEIPAVKSPLTKPFILSLHSKEELEHAVSESLGAGEAETKRIISSMKDYKLVSFRKVKQYSAKKKKKIWVREKITNDFEFTPGIYIVRLDKKLNVVKADRVSAVYLDPQRYQNQQYLKNSYFAETEQEKNL